MTNTRVGEMNLFPSSSHHSNCTGSCFRGALAVLCGWLLTLSSANAGPVFGDLRGVTRSVQGAPLPGVQVRVHSVEDNTDRNIVSNDQGAFLVENLRPGRYELRAAKAGLASSTLETVDLKPQQDLQVDMTLTSAGASKGATIQTSPLIRTRLR